MDIIDELEIIEKREVRKIAELEELRRLRQDAIERLRRQRDNHPLDMETVAELIEYNYFTVSRMNLPFTDRKIMYLDLLEWVAENRPARRKRLESNYQRYLYQKKKIMAIIP